MELLQIATKSDRNGNACRMWIAIQDGAIVDGERENLGGKPERFRDHLSVRINVSPAEWRAWDEQLAAVLDWRIRDRMRSC